MTIASSSPVSTVTISPEGVAAVLGPTPLANLAAAVNQFAARYTIDPNFYLGYARAENNFGLANTFSVRYHNIFDILCVNAQYNGGAGPHGAEVTCGDPAGNQFASGCLNPGQGWCYATYPDGPTGVEAAFWQASRWVALGDPSWGALLTLAGGVGDVVFAQNALDAANAYASQYPPTYHPPNCPPGYVYDPNAGGCVPVAPLPGLPVSATALAALVGAGLLAGAGYLIWKVA